jgi:hypothetical protein
MFDIAILVVGLTAYLASVIVAVKVTLNPHSWKERRFQCNFWKGLPYLIGVMPAAYFWKHGTANVLGGMTLFAALTWVIVWGFKRELSGTPPGNE